MQKLGSEQLLQGAEAQSANPRMDKLFQNREHERAVQESWREHKVPTADVHLEALENTEEQSKAPDADGCTSLGGVQDCV